MDQRIRPSFCYCYSDNGASFSLQGFPTLSLWQGIQIGRTWTVVLISWGRTRCNQKKKGKKRKVLLGCLLFFRKVVDVPSIYGEGQHPSILFTKYFPQDGIFFQFPVPGKKCECCHKNCYIFLFDHSLRQTWLRKNGAVTKKMVFTHHIAWPVKHGSRNLALEM